MVRNEVSGYAVHNALYREVVGSVFWFTNRHCRRDGVILQEGQGVMWGCGIKTQVEMEYLDGTETYTTLRASCSWRTAPSRPGPYCCSPSPLPFRNCLDIRVWKRR